eukprot:gene17688-20403_t
MMVVMFVMTFFSFLASSAAFLAQTGAGRSILKASTTSLKMNVADIAPAVITPLSNAMTTLPVSLEVTFAAYLAVIVGTLVPVTFLITLYSQSEARKSVSK